MKTLGQIKASLITGESGILCTDPRFVKILNEAVESLLNMGRWWGTYKKLRVCVVGGCITWPREVAAVSAFQVGRNNLPIRNGWWEFMEDVVPPKASADGWPSQLLNRESSATQQEPLGHEAKKLRFYLSLQSDAGKRVLVQGLDHNGNVVRSQDSAGVWHEGEWVTLSHPLTTTTSRFRPGISLQFEARDGDVVLCQVLDEMAGTEWQLGRYAPDEVNPVYRRSFVNGLSNGCSTALPDGCVTVPKCADGVQAIAIAKLAFRPVAKDTDRVLIGNIPALKQMFLSVHKQTSDSAASERHRTNAIRELRNELNQMSPKTSTTVSVALPRTDSFMKAFN